MIIKRFDNLKRCYLRLDNQVGNVVLIYGIQKCFVFNDEYLNAI